MQQDKQEPRQHRERVPLTRAEYLALRQHAARRRVSIGRVLLEWCRRDLDRLVAAGAGRQVEK